MKGGGGLRAQRNQSPVLKNGVRVPKGALQISQIFLTWLSGHLECY